MENKVKKDTVCTLQYAIDLSIPPKFGMENNEMVEFASEAAMAVFMMTDKVAKAAVAAERYQAIYITPDPKS